jgi:rod shape-determining protein MreD
MKAPSLSFFFALALFATLFGSILFPFFTLTTFAPFLALVYYRTSLLKALWVSFGCGSIMDCLSSEFHFGIYALSYTATTLLLFGQKRHFFEDKSVAFSLFTALISAVLASLELTLAHLFDRGLPFTFSSVFTDLFLLPIIDGLYGFLWFTCPGRLYIYIKKTGWKRLSKGKTHEES